MKAQRLLLVLTLVNLLILAIALGQMRPAAAEGVAPILRGRALQIVDEDGKVRASIEVIPATRQKDGEISAETVLLRLITEKGRPSVKIGASEESAMMGLIGPSNTKNTYVTMGSKGTSSSLLLKDEDGRQQIVKP